MSSFTPSLNMGDPATQVNDNAINERATRSLFGRVNYSYDDRYLFLTLSTRHPILFSQSSVSMR